MKHPDNRGDYDGEQARIYEELRTTTFMSRIGWSREFALVNEIFGAWLIDNAIVLDAPTGTGRFLPLLRQLGYRVTGIDISRDMLQIADGRAKSNGVNLVLGDCEFLPFKDKSFDYVMSIRFMGHLPPKTRIKVLQEFKRVSKKGTVVGFPILDPVTFLKFKLGNIRYRLRTGEKRPWWPANPRSLAEELAEAGLRISGKRWLLRPLSHIAFLYLVPLEPYRQDDGILDALTREEQIHASMVVMDNKS